MKKAYLLLLAGMFPVCLYAQTLQSVTTSGNTTNRLVQITGLTFIPTSGAGLELYGNADSSAGYIKAYNRDTKLPGTLNFQDAGGNTIINQNGGMVGIGTATPATTLDVKGKFKVSNGWQTISFIDGSSTSGYALSVGLNDNGVNFTNDSWYRGYVFNNLRGNLLTILPDGNVGINTTDTKGYKLAVNGSAIFTQVRLKAFSNWPDFVFHKDYVLPPLSEVEAFIKTNQHLPEIPSAAEVEKEGLDLGEMNRKMLQKIEEVTLYLIELKKENEILKKENRQVIERMKSLEEIIKK